MYSKYSIYIMLSFLGPLRRRLGADIFTCYGRLEGEGVGGGGVWGRVGVEQEDTVESPCATTNLVLIYLIMYQLF